jgi:tetratricopeptide (TPR) repeat protein
MPVEEKNKARNPVAGFFAELKRRRILHMGGAYIAGAWLGAEILSFLFEQFNAPDWTFRFLAIVFVVGFPVTMILAWVVQVQEDGSWAIDPSRGDYRTVAVAIALGVLATAGLSWLIVPERVPEPAYEPLANSLAVLPFGDHDELYRSLIVGLEQSHDLTLVRLGPGETPDDLYDFGESLGVAYLASGGTDMQLLQIAQEDVAWSQSYEWNATRTLETSHAMANGLLEAMALPQLSVEEFTGTGNRAAYVALLSGRTYASTFDVASLNTAIKEFEKALVLDPGYLLAHVGLAQAIYDLLAIAELPDEERRALEDRAGSAVDTAPKLDRTSADAISLLGMSASNSQLRIQAFERALELDPDHYLSYYRYALEMKADDKLEEAERLIRRAIALSPTDARFQEELAAVLEQQKRVGESEH